MSYMIGPVEVALTKNEGWGWHCYRCQKTRLRLDAETARRQAREHVNVNHPSHPAA